MNAGKLNRRITIQTPSAVQDGVGQPTQNWADLTSTWASIRVASGKDVYATQGFVSQVSHVITIRWRSDVKIRAGQRVLYTDRIFQVQAVSDPDEGRKQMNLVCLEIN